MACSEELLDKQAVFASQTRMMDADPIGKQILQVLALGSLSLLLEYLSGLRLFSNEFVKLIFGQSHISDDLSSPRSFLPRVNEYQDLMLSSPLNDLFIAYLIHQHQPFNSLLL